MKKEKENAKKVKELLDHEAGKKQEKREKIAMNLKAVRHDLRAK